ncbi:MAG: hypothetical protein HYW27_00025 [Candidatus Aenigmarchaeota archaeon]|nr:hypothetical protein [Candidatus Aenigmarchaeota archaeon]
MWVNDIRCKNGGYKQNILQTHRFKTFEIFRNRWYNKERIKIIPKDFQFTPDSILQFYLGDGNFYREIRLCVSGFDIKHTKFLRKLLIINLNIKSRLVTSPSLNGKADLIIKKSDTNKFLKYIGNSPVKCYEYKFVDNRSKSKRLEDNKRARERYKLNKKVTKNDIRNTFS